MIHKLLILHLFLLTSCSQNQTPKIETWGDIKAGYTVEAIHPNGERYQIWSDTASDTTAMKIKAKERYNSNMPFSEFADFITNAFKQGWFSFISSITAIISLIIAYSNYRRKVNLKKQNVADLWVLFVKQQNTFNLAQSALRNYQSNHAQNPNISTLTDISKTEIFVQNVFEDITKLLVSHDVTLTDEKVDYLLDNKIISPYDRKLFTIMINKKWQTKWWYFFPKWYKSLKKRMI